jgi:hypothetical protein
VGWTLEEAATLGLLAAKDIADKTVQVSLSVLGRSLLRSSPGDAQAALRAHLPELVDHVVIQSDLTAIAPGQLSGELRRELELMADVESSGAATVFRFTEASLGRAFDIGRTAAELEDVLDRHAPRGVPQTLRYLIADVARRHGRVRVGLGCAYVRCDDPAVLAELCSSRKARGLGLRLLAPTVAIASAPPEQVMATLRANGAHPVREDEAGVLVAAGRPRRAPAHSKASACRGGVNAPSNSEQAPTPAVNSTELARQLLAAAPRMPSPPTSPSASSRSKPRVGSEERSRRGEEQLFDPVPLRSDLHVVSDQILFDDEAPDRPTQIARWGSALALLTQARDEGWLVRLSFVNPKGRSIQLTGEVVDAGRRFTMLVTVPSCVSQRLDTDRIEWVRVLTEAEEDAL